MAHFLAGAFGVEQAVGEHTGGEWPFPGVRVTGRQASSLFRKTGFQPVGSGRRDAFLPCQAGSLTSEGGEDAFRPRSCGAVVIDIAIDPRMHALRAEFLEALVADFPELAERRVVRVAEREDGVAEVRERRRGVGAEVVPKGLRVVGRVAVAVGAGDDEDVFLLGQIDGFILRHVHELGRKAALRRFLRRLFRQPLGGAGLAAVQEHQRLGGRGGCGGETVHRAGGEGGVGEKSGEVAVEPEALFRGERGVVWNERNRSHVWLRSFTSR